MANKKISEFPVVGTPLGNDIILGDHIGTTSTFTLSSVKDYVVNNTDNNTLVSKLSSLFIRKPTSAIGQQVLTYNGSTSTWVASAAPQPVTLGTAKAWVNFNGSLGDGVTPTILASFNVSSVSRMPGGSGIGRFTVNFTTPFSNANYAVAGVCRNEIESSSAPSIAVGQHTTKTASSCPIAVGTFSTLYDDSPSVMVVFFGN